MKKLLTIALLLITATCFAGDISTIAGKAIGSVSTIAGKAKSAIATVGGGVVPSEGGGTPASGIYRPNADITATGWSDPDDNIDIYLFIDEAVTAPTAGGGDAISAWETAGTYEAAFPEITGTISTIRIHHYSKIGSATDAAIGFALSRDGVSWETEVGTVLDLNDVYEWNYVDVTGLSWDGTTDLRIRIRANSADHVYFVDVLYLEANP